MTALKTKKTSTSVSTFLTSVEDEQRRKDSFELLEIFQQVTKMPAVIWGNSIVGFGEYHYQSERSRQEGDWPLTGFSPRKRNMTVYIMSGLENYRYLLNKLGQHKTSVSFIYFNKLENIDVQVLKKIVRQSVADMKQRYKWK